MGNARGGKEENVCKYENGMEDAKKERSRYGIGRRKGYNM